MHLVKRRPSNGGVDKVRLEVAVDEAFGGFLDSAAVLPALVVVSDILPAVGAVAWLGAVVVLTQTVPRLGLRFRSVLDVVAVGMPASPTLALVHRRRCERRRRRLLVVVGINKRKRKRRNED